MKKIVCILLTLTMVMSLSMAAFADEPKDSKTVNQFEEGNSALIDVEASVSGGDTLDIVYSIKIEWDIANDLALEASCPYIWDAETLKYVPNSSASPKVAEGKDSADVDITITNNSNAAVYYAITYTEGPEASGIVSSTFTTDNETTGSLARADAAYSTWIDEDYYYNAIPFRDSLESTTGAATSAEVTGTVAITAGSTAPTSDTVTVGTFQVLISNTALEQQQ